MISKIFKANSQEVDLRLDRFLSKKGLNFSLSQKLLRKKLIKVNNQRSQASYRLKDGDEIMILANIDLQERKQKKKNVSSKAILDVKNSIIFQDDNVITINKKPGLAVQAGSKIEICVDDILPYLKFDNEENPKLVHRLDKDTSGLLLIARNRKAADLLATCFKNKTIQKTYFALVKGIPSKKSGVINVPLLKKYQGNIEKVYKDEINGKEAITNYKLIESYPDTNLSLLEVSPVTGRTHQIRVHLKEIGHPIIGDFKYGSKNTNFEELGLKKRLYLHAFKIEIADFFGKKLEVLTHKNLNKNYLKVFTLK